jgi:endothelin-converting enzyme/putative endopeptidase
LFKTTSAAILCAAALLAQTPPPSASSKPSPLRFDINSLDKSADPCVDFYQFACGTWKKNNPIPADQSRWGRFSELADRNRDVLHEILEEAAKPDPNRDAVTRQIGDYYAACMDEKAINAEGLKPIQPVLDRIRGMKDRNELAAEIARLQRSGVSAVFEFGSGQDFKDSTQVIAQLDQGGLGLPDRDYYLKDDPKSVELRQKYAAHVAKMFELMGKTPAEAKTAADTVMRIETALAKGSLDNVSRRDPEKVYHKMTRQELAALSPNFQWNQYIQTSGSPEFQNVNVAWPDFFKALNAQLQNASLEDWKTYLTWHVLHSQAQMLPTAFVQENFNFFGKTLTGADQMRPRWKRCVDFTDAQLGEALGQKFVERTFGKEGKARTLAMVDQLEKALGQDIKGLSWMTAATKQKALEKLAAIKNKIGYPDHWRDYSSVTIKRDDAAGNAMRADQFEFQRQLNKIGKPVDRNEWEMSPPTVNAYYDPLMNDINFPAGILQPPFYDNDMDDAVNYGGIGMVIGHELTHGFDDQGSQFDAKGNLQNWWTPEDSKEFNQREACIVNEYSKFTVAPQLNVNGKLTLGENTADNGGVRVALMALQSALANKPRQEIGGFTPEQRFFLAFAQIWCENDRPEAERLQVTTDPHSPARFRVNGVVQNMPEFQKAFSCKAGQPMTPVNACHVW